MNNEPLFEVRSEVEGRPLGILTSWTRRMDAFEEFERTWRKKSKSHRHFQK